MLPKPDLSSVYRTHVKMESRNNSTRLSSDPHKYTFPTPPYIIHISMVIDKVISEEHLNIDMTKKAWIKVHRKLHEKNTTLDIASRLCYGFRGDLVGGHRLPKYICQDQ